MQDKTEIRENNLYLVTLNGLTCGALFLGIYLFQFYFPVAYNYFVSEDSWVEYGTFACYMMAGLLVLGAMIKDRSVRRPGYMLLCAALFFVALEEVSWGQRFFGMSTPHIIAQYNYQAEISLHNSSFFPSQDLLNYAILIWALILPEIYRKYALVNGFFNKAGVPIVLRWMQPYFILGFILKLKNFKAVVKSGELGELIIGLGFTMFAVDAFYRVLKDAKKTNITRNRLIGWAIMIALTVTTLMVFAGPKDIYALRRQLHNSAVTEYPQHGMHAQAKEIFEYLVHHEELKDDNTLFQYGLFLKDIKSQDAQATFLKALQEAKERMRLTPEKPAPNILAGKIFKELNQKDLAEKEFQEALRKDQERLMGAELGWQRVTALRSLGETYIEIGNYELAREHLNRAYEYAEDGGTKAKIENLLETINSP